MLADYVRYPRSPATVIRLVRSAVPPDSHGDTVRALALWGIRPAGGLGQSEVAFLEFMAAFRSAIEDWCRVTFSVEFILADNHARINRYPEQQIVEYVDSVAPVARDFGFGARTLSSIVPLSVIEERLENRRQCREEARRIWDTSSPTLRRRLILGAQRHVRHGSWRAGLLGYLCCLSVERHHLLRYSGEPRLCLTLNSTSYRSTLPRAPTLFLWCGPARQTTKPWFAPGN